MVMDVTRNDSTLLQQVDQSGYLKPTKKNESQAEIIAKEYRDACQKDSSIDHFCLSTKKYHIISAVWMNNFITFASSSKSSKQQKTRDSSAIMDISADEKKSDPISDDDCSSKHPGKIKNSSLLQSRNSQSQLSNPQQPSMDDFTNDDDADGMEDLKLRLGLSHGKEYAIIGPHSWKVLSTKFGFDYNLERPIIILSNQKAAVEIYSKSTHGSTARLVLLPLGGQWDLPKSFRSKEEITDEYSTMNDLFPFGEDDKDESMPETATQIPSNQHLALIPIKNNNNYDNEIDNSPARKKIKKMGRCGLTNLGNTCFMNSSLQCLAHTTPLRNYFLSNEYKNHLNKENPLGTGGELAVEFAKLLHQMWASSVSMTSTYDRYYTENSLVVTPRNFKMTLGKNASQFIGYDQHDSHELATYLLDALHEDTNLITKKPYVEKTEKKDNEDDRIAAARAWQECLERDDSKIVESFMGQVKSRVECPTINCGRVSTTFDPYMYLSVPIPGSQDRTIELFFVPLCPLHKVRKIKVTLAKSSTIVALKEKVSEKTGVSKENIAIADVWKNEIYSVYKSTSDVGMLKAGDKIYAYELKDTALIRHERKSEDDDSEESHEQIDDDEIIIEVSFMRGRSNYRPYNTPSPNNSTFATPILMRIPASETVNEFRSDLGRRLKGILNTTRFAHDRSKEMEKQAENDEVWSDCDDSEFPPLPTMRDKSSKEKTSIKVENEEGDNKPEDMTNIDDKCSEDSMSYSYILNDSSKEKNKLNTDILHESAETTVMRSISLTFQRKARMGSYGRNSAQKLGELPRSEIPARKFRLASPTHKDELEIMGEVIGSNGRVNLFFETYMLDYFNVKAWETVDDENYEDEDEDELETANDKPITIQQCIDSFCQKEQLEESEKWYCNKCKEHVRAWKQFHMYSAAPILIIQLKRFYFSSASHRRDKIGTFIDFPLNGLDLRDTVMNWSKDEEPIYDCYAVSNHYGGLGGGHYTAYAKNNGQWCYFNDSRVTEVKDESEVVSDAAYVLYYRRRDIEDWDRTLSASIGSSSSLSSSPSSSSPLVGELSIVSQDNDLPRSIQSTYPHSTEDPDKEMESVSSSANVTQASCGSPIESVSEDGIDDADDTQLDENMNEVKMIM